MSQSFETATALTPAETEDPDWYVTLADLTRLAVSLNWKHFPEEATLDFVPAGRQGRVYASRVTSFDWHAFYERLGGGTFLRTMRERLRTEYDFVLIDCDHGPADLAALEALPVGTGTLGEIATVTQTTTAPSVVRVDGERTAQITARPEADDLGAVTADLQTELDDLDLPEGATTARAVPVVVALPEVGVLGIAGPRGDSQALARWLVVQSAVWHSPRDLQVVVLCQEGFTSSLAAAALQDLGLHRATDVVGGWAAWREDLGA